MRSDFDKRPFFRPFLWTSKEMDNILTSLNTENVQFPFVFRPLTVEVPIFFQKEMRKMPLYAILARNINIKGRDQGET